MTKQNQISGILLCTIVVLLSSLAISKAPERLRPATRTADGVPLPPPIKPSRAMELADGVPLPPPIKPAIEGTMLVADGVPLPPPIKPLTIANS